MTKQELNRDIKRLHAKFKSMEGKTTEEIVLFIMNEGRREFIRLYNEDIRFEKMNLASLKFMLRLNLKHRYISLHNFGLLISI